MNPSLPALSWSASFALAGGLTLLVRAIASEGGPAHVLLGGHVRSLNDALRFLRLRPVGQHVVAGQLIAMLVLIASAHVTNSWAPALFLCIVTAGGPNYVVQLMRRRRLAKLEGQLDGFLMVLANALRATPSIAESLEMSARLLPAPLGEELDLMLKEYRLGASLDQALTAMGQRVQSRALNTAIGTLRAARRTGGDVPATLTISAQTLREMARLDAVLEAQTAGPRMQLKMIVGIPFLIIGGMHATNPHYFDCLFETPRGYMVGAGAVLLWLTSLIVGRVIMASSVK